jgi:ubiquitin carboxyl-terminal hydrolase 14
MLGSLLRRLAVLQQSSHAFNHLLLVQPLLSYLTTNLCFLLLDAAAGRYELTGVLTHKGRSADSGHYVAWTKQADGRWVLFDDDELHFKTAEDVLALNGGGDWHMAYLLMYKAVTVPEGAVPAAAAAAPKAEGQAEGQPEPMKAE